MKKLPNRKTIRLPGYDYALAGYYFITLCVYNHDCLFGKIKNGCMYLNERGKIIDDEWRKTAVVRKNVKLDEYVIMPNHIHAIIIINNDSVGATRWVARNNNTAASNDNAMPTGPDSGTIGAIIGQFKSVASKRMGKLYGSTGCPLWQRNYYEHIIRNGLDLINIRQYIIDNPTQWDNDIENIGITRATHRVAPTVEW